MTQTRKPSTRNRIIDLAASQGWKVSTNGNEVLFTRKGRHLFVVFSVRGGVVSASTDARSMQGPGKAERVLNELAVL
jgi:hypothetical protein